MQQLLPHWRWWSLLFGLLAVVFAVLAVYTAVPTRSSSVLLQWVSWKNIGRAAVIVLLILFV